MLIHADVRNQEHQVSPRGASDWWKVDPQVSLCPPGLNSGISNTGCYRLIHADSVTGCYRVLQAGTVTNAPGCYRLLHAVTVTGCYRVLQAGTVTNATGCYRVLQVVTVTGCYRVLQGATGCYCYRLLLIQGATGS